MMQGQWREARGHRHVGGTSGPRPLEPRAEERGFWGKFWGSGYFGDGFWGPAGYTFVAVVGSPQTIQIVIQITAAPQPEPIEGGAARVILVAWGPPGLVVSSGFRIPPPT